MSVSVSVCVRSVRGDGSSSVVLWVRGCWRGLWGAQAPGCPGSARGGPCLPFCFRLRGLLPRPCPSQLQFLLVWVWGSREATVTREAGGQLSSPAAVSAPPPPGHFHGPTGRALTSQLPLAPPRALGSILTTLLSHPTSELLAERVGLTFKMCSESNRIFLSLCQPPHRVSLQHPVCIEVMTSHRAPPTT